MSKKVLMIIAGLGILAAGAYAYKKYAPIQKESVPEAIEASQLNDQARLDADPAPLVLEPKQEADIQIPDELNLKMAFYSQAPFGDWSYPWQEACEEASVLLVANEYGQKNWTREQFRDEILKLVDWQMERFGAYEHTDMAQTEEILSDYLGLETKVHENPTFEDIQRILAKGHFIVAPFAGKKLGNPFYSNGGPIYHVLVIKGYKANQRIITADVGTRQGEDYVYGWETVQKALHDYAEPIEEGASRVIEVIPPEA